MLGKTKVFHRCWLLDKVDTIIVGVHGFAEHSGRYTHVGEAFLEHRYAFCTHDLRGHGKTAAEGDAGYVEKFDDFLTDLENYIKIIAEKHKPKKIVLLGHSMGGLIVLHYLARIKSNVDAAVTSGAATIIKVNLLQLLFLKTINMLNPRIRLNLPIKPELLSHNQNVVKSYIEDPLVVKKPTARLLYELIRASQDVWKYIDRIEKPLLLLHGEKDQVVPPKASIDVYNRIKYPEKELKIYKDLYHEILNENSWREIIKDIISWLYKTIK
ncbi:MAG: alpha/beta hydrolase [Ignisphaera sp.]|uniref:Alpha/beta hydrolase n=1 Tax=Ignisphaera aggregans TaxID=334771 RepID=A0A832CR19_9CREN